MIIKISITNKRAIVEGDPVLVCGNSDYSIEFTFDGDWADLAEKKARFVWTSNGEQQHVDVDITDNRAQVPILSGTTEVLVGVFGGHLRATTPARIRCEYSVRCVM